MNEHQVLFRYEEYRNCSVDEWENVHLGLVHLYLHEYDVLSTTKHGVRIKLGLFGKRFVKLGTKKQFAHTTKEKALVSYIDRKQRHIRILQAQLVKPTQGLQIAEAKLSYMLKRNTSETAQTLNGICGRETTGHLHS